MDISKLQERFPNLKPISSPPSLVTINGIGLTIYGARDHDAETGTYVKTRVFSVLFFPLLALDAYRVAQAQNGWYFLGREPLSTVAKSWNGLVALLLVAVIAIPVWNDYTTSPDYLARQQLARARQELDEGKLPQALRDFAELASHPTSSTAEARKSLGEIFVQRLPQATTSDQITGISTIAHLPKAVRHEVAEDSALIAVAKKLMTNPDDPRAGMKALDAITPLLKPEEVVTLKEPLLVALVAKEPGEAKPASDLAEIYDARGDAERCEAVLTPVRTKLGSLEGARILGRIDAAKGRNEESYQLLFPYCKDRLKNLQALEKRYQSEEKRAYKSAYDALNNGAAGDAWYAKYKGLDEKRQQDLAETWVLQRVKSDAQFSQALESLRKAAVIVPVALDLGVVTLQRAQAMSDPAARKKELEAAEQTFLAIKGIAGEDDSYHLSYGQVCYWLGKHEDGQKEFDALLDKNKRSQQVLLAIANIMREVGAADRARTLCEEAYGKAKTDEERFAAANLRALTHTDNEDSLTWLERCDQHSPWVVCYLNYARGNKALADGDNAKAAEALRACVAGYEAMPKSSSTLNNGALAIHSLFQVTGNLDDLEKGNRWLEEAITLEPSDSILMKNLAHHLQQAGVTRVVGERVDQVALRMTGDTDLLYCCYRDQAGRSALCEQMRADANVKRAISYFEKLLVLSPKSGDVYAALRLLYLFTEDLPGLRTLQQRLTDAHLDLERDRQNLQDLRSGKNDQRLHTSTQARIRFLDALLADPKLPHPSLTHSVALTELQENLLQDCYVGGARDDERTVQLADQAYAEAPTYHSLNRRIYALLFRALQREAGKAPAVATLMRDHRFNLSEGFLIVLLCNDPAYQADLVADPDVQQAATLMKERMTSLPSNAYPDNWALLTALKDPAAATLSEALKRDEIGAVASRIQLDLHPLSADSVLTMWWLCQATGDRAGATEVLATARKNQVTLPPQVQ